MAAPGSLPAAEGDPAIFGGSTADTCEWPSVVWLTSVGCTGTLVHPELIVTAAHCVESSNGIQQVHFVEEYPAGVAKTIVPATCVAYPQWSGQLEVNEDFGYCKLSQPVTDVPIVPVLRGCEEDEIYEGQDVTLVGFGATSTSGSGIGRKRIVHTKIDVVDGANLDGDIVSTDEIWVGGGGEGPSSGDSGGPAFVQLTDGTWRIFGIESWGWAPSGGGSTNGAEGGSVGKLYEVIDWIESSSGIDITPCHDGNGGWAPQAGCGGFPLEPGSAHGTWANGCSGGPISGSGQSCGSPFADASLPTVSIVDPSSGAVLNPDANNRASVHVLAMAADDVAVMEVELWVDNQAVGADAGPPYEWDIELDLGDHDLRAVATDLAGNEGESTIVTIAVGSSGPVTTGTSTSGGGPGPSGTGDSGASGADSGADGSSGADTEGDNSGGFGFDGSQGGSSCACTTSRRPATGFGLAALALWFGTRRRKKPRSSAQPSRARRIENRRRPATKPAQRRGEADES